MGSGAGRCPTCSAPVEPDWLTCRSCGAILAAGPPPAWLPTDPADAAAAERRRRSDAGAVARPGQPATAARHRRAAATLARRPSTRRPSRQPRPPSGEPGARAQPVVLVARHARWRTSAAETPPSGRAPQSRKAGVFADLPLAIPETAGGRVAGGRAGAHRGRLLPALVTAPAGHQPVRCLGLQPQQPDRRLPRRPRPARCSSSSPSASALALRTGWLPALFGIFVVGVFWERVDAISVVGPGAWLFAIGGLMSLVGGMLTLARPRPSGPSGAAGGVRRGRHARRPLARLPPGWALAARRRARAAADHLIHSRRPARPRER